MARFVQHSRDDDPPHRFEVYDFAQGGEALVDELAADVRALYLDDDFDTVLAQAARDLDAVADPAAIAELVRAAAQSAVPAPAQRTTQPWLDTARNELGEVICYAALEEILGASVLARRIRHKEVPHLPTRGMDAVALGDDPAAPHALRLYLSETKSSSSADSPPGVVDRGEDCLHAQLLTAVQQRTKVASELARAVKYVSGDEQLRLARAMVLWARRNWLRPWCRSSCDPGRVTGRTTSGCFAVTPRSSIRRTWRSASCGSTTRSKRCRRRSTSEPAYEFARREPHLH